MAKKKKKMPGLNTSSTADISFMLLIFFLVTTSMDTDTGLARRLPQPPDKDQDNAAGQLWCKVGNISEYIALEQLKPLAKEFIDNPNNSSKLPEKFGKEIDLLGASAVTEKHVISVQTDRGTPYDVYFQVQNELVAAYNELRDDLSKRKFGRLYANLTDEQQVAVRTYYPQKISEAEPKNYGGN